MSELRQDPIVGRWVIIAKNRAERPFDLVAGEPARRAEVVCPFCEGHEEHTPHEIAACRAPGTQRDRPGWRVRVVPNKFPALTPDSALQALGDGFFESRPAVGAHELIVEAPEHVTSSTQLSDDRLREVLWMYRERMLALKEDKRITYALVFKNVGAAAGASIEHVHSQLIAMPVVPTSVLDELSGSHRFYQQHGRCVFCEMVARELAAERRVVERSDGFVAFCPFAGRNPFETWIVPIGHASHYETLSVEAAAELARVLKRTLTRIKAALAMPAYNYFIHTAPFDTLALGHYHWHMEIIPRVTEIAGFEWGAGFYINPVPPEEAAATLRSIAAN